jgi:hypothetical protein
MPFIIKSHQGGYEVWDEKKLLKKCINVYIANRFLKKLLENKNG